VSNGDTRHGQLDVVAAAGPERAEERGVGTAAEAGLASGSSPRPQANPGLGGGRTWCCSWQRRRALLLAIAAYPPSPLERSFVAVLACLPGWLDPVWRFFADLLWLWALVLVVVALVRVRLVVVAQAAALVLGALLALCAARHCRSRRSSLGRLNALSIATARSSARRLPLSTAT